MSAPKLPSSLPPPQIPSSMLRKVDQQQPPKSNFFLIMMMTFLFIWTLQIMKRREPEPEIPFDTTAQRTTVAPTLSDEAREALPKEFLAAAETFQNTAEPTFVTLGSLAPDSPYRFLVTLTNRGAALARVESSEEAYIDYTDRTGYLGQIIVDESYAWNEFDLGLPGLRAQVVGDGTPAQRAGLKPNDRIVGFTDANGTSTEINEFTDLRNALLKTKPGDKVTLEIYEAERLEKDEDYRLAHLTLAKYMVNEEERRDDIGELRSLEAPESEEQDSASDESDTLLADGSDDQAKVDPQEESAAADDETALVASDVRLKGSEYRERLGAPKTLEVELSDTPLSILRPSGMVLNYEDYTDLVGLQGVYHGNNDALYFNESRKKTKGGDTPRLRKLNSEPSSFLATLSRVDDDMLDSWAPSGEGGRKAASTNALRSLELDSELGGVRLRNGYWDYDADASNESTAVFRKILLDRQLEVVKKYELVAGPSTNAGDVDSFVKNDEAYHLKLSLEIKNYDPNASHVVSYMLDGPTGLPLEGAWFAAGRKTGPGWGAYGMRDVVVSSNDQKNFNVVKCVEIAQDKTRQSDELRLDFLGVDGQYFQCTSIPYYDNDHERKFAFSPIRVGSRVVDHMNFTDVSYRLKSDDRLLAPHGQAGDSFKQDFVVFIGPKKRDVMSNYGLEKTIVYGWFWFVSIPLLWILHFCHDYLVFNYGLAIILLTILVRFCLFPLSRKQVLSSMRMQKLQPEIAKLKEKHQDNPQELMVAQQALFRKYGINPLSGCLPIFIQMPIFIGLYRALSIDVSLYGAPLFSRSVRWCSNLAAPDMAFNWSNFWNSIGWESFNLSGRGFLSFFALGPYFNLLPVITISLFLLQQKLLVPPVVGDDAQAKQQRTMRRMMTFMMIFMGFMFFKVPSGLCLYFIVSSLWGLLERKVLPLGEVELKPVNEVAPARSRRPAAAYSSRASGRSKSYAKFRNRQEDKPKGALRAWWDEVVERAQEQQRLVKSEQEGRSFNRGRSRRKRR
jgi:YidC/Oxa1 family membrane protein insertase